MARVVKREPAWFKALEQDIAAHRRAGRHEEAVELLHSTASDATGIDLAKVQLLLGEILSDTGNHSKAQSVLQSAHQALASWGDPTWVALSAASLAENLRRMRGEDNQVRGLEIVREAGKRLKRRSGLAKCRLALAEGRILLERRQYWDAYQHLKSAFGYAGSRRNERAAAARSLGLFFGAIGRTSQARKWFERALDLYVSKQDHYGVARACGELGRLFLDRGEHGAAKAILEKGLDSARNLADKYQLAHILNDLGRANAGLGRNGDAESLFEQCLTVCRNSGLDLVAAFAVKNIAKLKWRSGEPDKALHMLDHAALPGFERLDNKFGTAVALRIKGRILRDLGEEQSAWRTLLQAQELFESVDALRQAAATKCDRARILADKLRRSPDDPSVLEQALSILDESLGLARSLADDRLVERIGSIMEEVDLDSAVKRHIAFIAGREQESRAAVLGGTKEVLTVLVADLQGFTAYSADRDPGEVLDTLNDYFCSIGEVIHEHQGTVDKYLGDGFMVLFRGDSGGHHPYRAVKAALSMLRELKKFNKEKRLARGLPPLETRIGINTGEAVVGNTGTYERMQLTAIGSAVNLAFRLEDRAPADSVLIGPATYRHLGGHFKTRKAAPFVPKGFGREVTPFVVEGERELVRFRPRFEPPLETAVKPGRFVIAGWPPRSRRALLQRGSKGPVSMAMSLYLSPSTVLEEIGNTSVEHATVTLPSPPSFDDVISAFFVQEILEHGVLPRGAPMLAKYAELHALYLLPESREPWNTPAGIFAGLCERDKLYGTPRGEGDLYLLRRGIYLCEYLCAMAESGGDLFHPTIMSGPHPFEREGEIFHSRFFEMLDADLKRSTRYEVRLPTIRSSRRKTITCISLEDPSPAASWVRSFSDSSARGRKPHLLICTWSMPPSTLISLSPEANAVLTGLRANLDRLEAGDKVDPTHVAPRSESSWRELEAGGFHGLVLLGPARGSRLDTSTVISALGARRRRRGQGGRKA